MMVTWVSEKINIKTSSPILSNNSIPANLGTTLASVRHIKFASCCAPHCIFAFRIVLPKEIEFIEYYAHSTMIYVAIIALS